MSSYNNIDFRLSHSTISQAQVPLFSSVKSNGNNQSKINIFENKGQGISLIVHSGELNQTHRSIIDIILSMYKPYSFDDGSLKFKFSLYDLQSKLGYKSKNNNASILGKFEDMKLFKSTINFIKQGKQQEIKFSILKDCYQESGDNSKGKPFIVVFDPEYIRLFDTDTTVRYSLGLLDSIVNLKVKPVQAFVRYCLSFESVSENLSMILIKIGISQSTRTTISNSRREIKSALADGSLSIFGITSNDDADPIISYRKHAEVEFDREVRVLSERNYQRT